MMKFILKQSLKKQQSFLIKILNKIMEIKTKKRATI